MSIRIVTLDETHLQDYKAIRLSALKNEPATFSGDYDEESQQGDDFHWIRLQVSTVYGAYVDGALVGMIGVIFFREKKLRHKAAIWGMYVEPAHRGAGISRQLMTHALDLMPAHVQKITLGVARDNQAALSLYQSCGFDIYGDEKAAFMHDGQAVDEYQMVKFI